MDPREKARQLLRDADLDPEAWRAKQNLDRKLEGLGLAPLESLPLKLAPGRTLGGGRDVAENLATIARNTQNPATNPRSASSGVLFNPLGAPPAQVIPSSHVDEAEDYNEALFEPSDLLAAQAATSLGTTAAGGTEVRFNTKGIAHVGSGAIGLYWNRALGAAQNIRWAPLAPNLLIPYDPRQGLFIGQNGVGGITVSGVLVLAFYKLPLLPERRDRPLRRPPGGSNTDDREEGSPWAGGDGDRVERDVYTLRDYRADLARRLAASGSDAGLGAIINALTNGTTGTDVTLGTFSDAGVGTQIYLAGSNMPVGGASEQGSCVLNAPPDNTDAVWVGETAALAVASNGGINAAGQDTWNIPATGKLFMLANSGTQKLGARFRS